MMFSFAPSTLMISFLLLNNLNPAARNRAQIFGGKREHVVISETAVHACLRFETGHRADERRDLLGFRGDEIARQRDHVRVEAVGDFDILSIWPRS